MKRNQEQKMMQQLMVASLDALKTAEVPTKHFLASCNEKNEKAHCFPSKVAAQLKNSYFYEWMHGEEGKLEGV